MPIHKTSLHADVCSGCYQNLILVWLIIVRYVSSLGQSGVSLFEEFLGFRTVQGFFGISELTSPWAETEAQSLKDVGFEFKNPTRKTAVMVALYKKAAAGDLSAIKELRSIVSEKEPEKTGGVRAVTIIDDLSGQTF